MRAPTPKETADMTLWVTLDASGGGSGGGSCCAVSAGGIGGHSWAPIRLYSDV